MRTFSFVNFYRKLLRNARLRSYSCKTEDNNKSPIENIRNIGILAHIDAGKTTTTERMLFYSGTIRSMGEVHHGNTVTDYMEQERQRGITITSAAVSFPWLGSQINLIDTPGHIDFTMEVEQSLAVLDGAVIVLDGSAGVEAQTRTVWHQASEYRVPRLLYLNKMDRKDSFEDACIASIKDKLQVTPLQLHTPVRYEGRLIGLIDIITQEEIIWTHGRGQNYTRRKLLEKVDGRTWEATLNNHRQLIDSLSSIDDKLAETIIQQESLDDIDKKVIEAAIRRCTVEMKAFPVLCGSSYKNIGVQTLMDAVVAYLPTPLECNRLYKSFDSELSARAFKVQHDDQRGVLTFLRLYGGEVGKGQKIFNLGQDQSETTGALYVALADEYKPVERVTAGNIAVVSSLKSTMPGDLVTSTQAAAARAKSRLSSWLAEPHEDLVLPSARSKLQALAEPTDEEVAEVLLGIGTQPPEPVFLCSIEPPSAGQQQALEAALDQLQREDRSLRVTLDSETQQVVLAEFKGPRVTYASTVISDVHASEAAGKCLLQIKLFLGMGELHLEIIKDRIIREYKIDVELGPLQIAYREALVGSSRRRMEVDRKIGSARQVVKVELSAKSAKVGQDKVLRLDKTAESAANLSHLLPRHLNAIKQGVQTALTHGPKLGCPMLDVQVTLHWFEVGRGTSESIVSSTVVQCLRKVFEESGSMLLEPVMSLSVVCPESHSSRVVMDLSRRRTVDCRVQMRHDDKIIECHAPLSELLGYSSALRSLSSGLASFTMEFSSYQQMAPQDEEKAIRAVTGC